jgi:flagellar protein FlgJ
VLADDNPMNSDTKQYRDMYDQQLAVSMSREGGGIGLQDVLVRQLSKRKASTVNTSPFPRIDGPAPALWGSKVASLRRPSPPPGATTWRPSTRGAWPCQASSPTACWPVSCRPPLLAMRPSMRRHRPVSPAVRQPARTYAAPAEGMRIVGRAVAQPPLAPNKAFGNSDAFVSTMLPMAEQAAKRIGIDPRYLVAQAALETGWGKSVMRNPDGSSSHNLFGIKATGNWQGGEARAITSEFRGGQFVKETAAFRSYDSYQDSFHDLVSLLQNNSRYKDAVGAADNPEQFARELQKAGYATDPDYARKIISIARQLQPTQQYAMAGTTTNL